MSRSIVWFRQDLRLHDNEALIEAIGNADEIIPVFIFDIHPRRTSYARAGFLIDSVHDLRSQLREMGSDLIVRTGKPDEILYQLARETRSQWVYCNRERTRDEVMVQDRLERNLWTIGRELRYTRGKMLYYTSDLPFPVTHCPDSYISFRKEVEPLIAVRLPLEKPKLIPALPSGLDAGDIPSVKDILPGKHPSRTTYFRGGETQGLSVLSSMHPNPGTTDFGLGGSMLSPWIAMGCLSPKKVYHGSFTMPSGGEEVRQNLIYRDYLRLMGKKYGDRIFYKSGIKNVKTVFQNNTAALQAWQTGNTGIEIIDAAMHQLNTTGWIPDIMRKIVANYLIRVLQLDWRLGAAYFESMLIDYDPCSNWVSWLNLSGYGPDSREDRIIHYDLIGKKLDPDGAYIRTWNR
jgi:deoxyribodipyrimidine photo-lyase